MPDMPATTTVLVLEEDEPLSALLIALLWRNGHAVERVRDFDEARGRLECRKYDAVILDIRPAQAGELASLAPDVRRRTIVLSSFTPRAIECWDGATVFALMRKPFEIDALVASVQACTRTSDVPAEGAIRRFETALPRLRRTLLAPPSSEREVMLREELRRAVARLGVLLSAVAELHDDDDAARRYARLGRNASALAAIPLAGSAKEHSGKP